MHLVLKPKNSASKQFTLIEFYFFLVRFAGRIAASDNEAVDWSGTDQGMVSTSSRRLPIQPPTEAVQTSTPTRGNSGRRSGGSVQINHNVHSKRPLTFS